MLNPQHRTGHILLFFWLQHVLNLPNFGLVASPEFTWDSLAVISLHERILPPECDQFKIRFLTNTSWFPTPQSEIGKKASNIKLWELPKLRHGINHRLTAEPSTEGTVLSEYTQDLLNRKGYTEQIVSLHLVNILYSNMAALRKKHHLGNWYKVLKTEKYIDKQKISTERTIWFQWLMKWQFSLITSSEKVSVHNNIKTWLELENGWAFLHNVI